MNFIRRIMMGQESLHVFDSFEVMEWAPSGLLFRKVQVKQFWGFTVSAKPGPWTESVRRIM